jgi:hypothetical protein
MKVIFLDFDGVLNSYTYLFTSEEDGNNDDSDGLDPRAVARVNAIVERTGAVVCLSTAWRLLHPMDDLKRFLRQRGFSGRVVGSTPDFSERYAARGEEVRAWLDKHAVESFVVLDDLREFERMRDRHVWTDGREGLLDEHIDLAVRILHTPLAI